MRALFTNRPSGREFTVNFFHLNAANIKSAQLACPFFTDYTPLQILKDARCPRIQLLVRLCEATSPQALEQAKAAKGVDVRFFTDRAFHAKFYILEKVALIGSANLTNAGLTSNRELSIAIEYGDEIFDEIPAMFDELWNSASVLTEDALNRFKIWRRNHQPQETTKIEGIESSSPFTISESTHVQSSVRTFLETFRSFYVEKLIPAHRLVSEIYKERPKRHPAFEAHPFTYELDRFLFWARHFTTDEYLDRNPLRQGDDLRGNIEEHLQKWFGAEDKDLHVDVARLHRIEQLQKLFSDEQRILEIGMETVADLLQGSAAFVEMLRFTKGGLENHIAAFKRDNDIKRVRAAFRHLAFGPGDYVQRIYDCIYRPEFKLAHWGRNCTLELFGWINREQVPPFNGRIIKALRYLGFDVPT